MYLPSPFILAHSYTDTRKKKTKKKGRKITQKHTKMCKSISYAKVYGPLPETVVQQKNKGKRRRTSSQAKSTVNSNDCKPLQANN